MCIIIIYGISLVHKLKKASDTNKGNTPEVEKQVQKKKIWEMLPIKLNSWFLFILFLKHTFLSVLLTSVFCALNFSRLVHRLLNKPSE